MQGLLALGALAQAAFLLLGGYIADSSQSSRIVRIGLIGLIVASTAGVLLPDPPVMIGARVLGWAAEGLIFPFAIGSIADVYRGNDRAVALGIAFGVLGLATAVAPILATLLGPLGPAWPALLACGGASAAALIAWRRHPVEFGHTDPAGRTLAGGVALGGFGIIAIVTGTVDFGDVHLWLRVAMILVGCIAFALALWLRQRLHMPDVGINARPLVIALVVGAAVGFAQMVPAFQMPLYFQIIQGASAFTALLAILPFLVALFVTGPVTDRLLRRYSPRILIGGGAIAVGLADLALAAVLTRTTSYVWFIVPLGFIGAGFVVSTSVRAALIFANMPSRLPSSAAALTQATVALGSRIGIVVATLIVSRFALSAFAAQNSELSPDVLAERLDQLRALLTVVGLPEFDSLIAGVATATVDGYLAAAVEGLRASLTVAGLVGVLGGALAFALPRAINPLATVWDLADERPSAQRVE